MFVYYSNSLLYTQYIVEDEVKIIIMEEDNSIIEVLEEEGDEDEGVDEIMEDITMDQGMEGTTTKIPLEEEESVPSLKFTPILIMVMQGNQDLIYSTPCLLTLGLIKFNF
jgi:hypothetical protein